MLRAAAREQALDGGVPAAVARQPDAVLDDAELQHDLLGIPARAAQRGERGGRLLGPLARQQPARGLGQPDHHGAEEQAEDDLEGDGEAPGEVGWAVGGAKVEPVAAVGGDVRKGLGSCEEEGCTYAIRVPKAMIPPWIQMSRPRFVVRAHSAW